MGSAVIVIPCLPSAPGEEKVAVGVTSLEVTCNLLANVGFRVGLKDGAMVGEVRQSWLAYPTLMLSVCSPIVIAIACLIAKAASVPDHRDWLNLDGMEEMMQMLATAVLSAVGGVEGGVLGEFEEGLLVSRADGAFVSTSKIGGFVTGTEGLIVGFEEGFVVGGTDSEFLM